MNDNLFKMYTLQEYSFKKFMNNNVEKFHIFVKNDTSSISQDKK